MKPCGHDSPEPRCRICELYHNNPIYRKMWGETRADPVSNCDGCSGKEVPVWAVGITTVPSRMDSLLPQTVDSVRDAGFCCPWLFVDGPCDPTAYGKFRIAGVTFRTKAIRVHGNWILGLYELYIRNPIAKRYLLCQDDIQMCKGVRQYLDAVPWPPNAYLNLFTYPGNQEMCKTAPGWYESNQRGKGALALAFTRRAVLMLLHADHMLMRPMPPEKCGACAEPINMLTGRCTACDKIDGEAKAFAEGGWHRGMKAVDGGIVTSFMQAGWKEYVHNPSLVQHTGTVSSFSAINHQPAHSFPGVDFDAVSLVK